MTWYVSMEHDPEEYLLINAGGKARADVTTILKSVGCEPLPVAIVKGRQSMGRRDKLAAHRMAYANWQDAVSGLTSGDVLVVQFPLVGHTIYFSRIVGELARRGVRLVLIIHDLDGLRYASGSSSAAERMRLAMEEKPALRGADAIIAHNGVMADAIARRYGVERSRIVSLGIFDYLAAGDVPDRGGSSPEPVCVAGNLTPAKSAYLEHLPQDVRFVLYGGGYEGPDCPNVEWCGVVPADELPARLEGGLGLVWDGDSSETCSGTTGQYLRINNPHKTSLYLAAGLPVVIWDQAALAPFIHEHGCGITISSLSELRSKIDSFDDSKYAEMGYSAAAVGRELRSGKYAKQAIEEVKRLL